MRAGELHTDFRKATISCILASVTTQNEIRHGVVSPSYMYPIVELSTPMIACGLFAVRNTVNTGRTVVCTIHQPSIDIFDVSACFNQGAEYRCQCFNVCLINISRLHGLLLPLISDLMCLMTSQAFDELLLLKRGGRTIYHGPIGIRAIDLVKVRKYGLSVDISYCTLYTDDES